MKPDEQNLERQPPPDEAVPARAGQWLRDEDFVEATGRIADIARAGLPLESGLRALSEEIPSRSLRNSLSALSRRLEAGESLEVVLTDRTTGVPWHLRGLLQAGLRTGNLGVVLEQYLQQSRKALDHRREALLALIYPLVLIVMVSVVIGFLVTIVVPQFGKIFNDFGTELPSLTLWLLGFSKFIAHYGLITLIVFVVAAVGAWFLAEAVGGRVWRRKLVCHLPVYGPLLRSAALARFCQVLALLVENRAALPDALRMAGQATGDAELEEGAVQLAAASERGIRLEDAANSLTQFPPALLQVFRWEGRSETFSDALRAAGEVFDSRATVRTGLLGVLLEPIVIAGVAVAIGGIVLALFLPLIKLLNDLS